MEKLPEILLKLGAAFVLALPVAWEREVQTRLMGLRTFPIVALASCSYLLIANELFPSDQAQARVLQGLVTGMGFIGGGAILKRDGKVEGTATAASLWATGAVGMAVAYSRLDIAIAISVIVFLTLRLLTPLERRLVDEETRERAETPGQGLESDPPGDDAPHHGRHSGRHSGGQHAHPHRGADPDADPDADRHADPDAGGSGQP